MTNKQKVIILTGLPFRRQGNQSMLRFVNMFLDRGIGVIMFSAGADLNGENSIVNSGFSLHKVYSLSISYSLFLNSKILNLVKKKSPTINCFSKISSEDIIPPRGNYNLPNLLNKWFRYLLNIIDNIILFFYLLLSHKNTIKEIDAVIGYEVTYTLASRLLARIFKKNYINKFQGTVLKATNRDISQAKKYFPGDYYGINKSNLCLMVNDGTDGEYYAGIRGCQNIFFEPHGVYNYKHGGGESLLLKQLKKDKKFVIFNNASGSTWKRTDRIIRGLSKLKPEILDKIVLLTTYYAENKEKLKDFVKLKGLVKNVIFLNKLTPVECNYIIQNSDVVVMTNDLSNLGNPILESIYYQTPIISVDDGSLDEFIQNGINSFLIKLDKDFDVNMALAIQRMYEDRALYKKFKANLNFDKGVRELTIQQEREFKVIQEFLK